jgi:pteridine reductase
MQARNEGLVDKVALVTGGGRRIGAEIAKRLHFEGMNLVLHYHSSDKEARALQSELNEMRPDSVMLIKGDLLDNRKITHLVQEAAEAHSRLDALVNNASSFFPTPIGATSEDDWNNLIGTNLKAPFFLSQAAAPELRKTQGCIVNVADAYGERPLKNHTVYSMAKAGLIMLTRSLARELAPQVRVNAVAPGAILWPENDHDEVAQQRIVSRTPLKRLGTPAEIAGAVLFLVRDAGFVSGHVIPVDGGRSVVP